MKIVYRDAVGYVAAEVDDGDVFFANGKAWFGVDGKDFEIDVANVVRIVNE